MIIVSPYSIDEVAAAILAGLHGATDHHGRQVVIQTIDPEHLRRAALGALTAALGDVVWPRGKVVQKGPEERLPFIETVYPR